MRVCMRVCIARQKTLRLGAKVAERNNFSSSGRSELLYPCKNTKPANKDATTFRGSNFAVVLLLPGCRMAFSHSGLQKFRFFCAHVFFFSSFRVPAGGSGGFGSSHCEPVRLYLLARLSAMR